MRERLCPRKVFLALLLSRYDVALEQPDEPVPPSDVTRVGLGVIGPQPGADVWARFPPRHQQPASGHPP